MAREGHVTPARGAKGVQHVFVLDRRGNPLMPYVGRVAVRSTGAFRVGTRDGIRHTHCAVLQRGDGYDHFTEKGTPPMSNQSLPAANDGISLARLG